MATDPKKIGVSIELKPHAYDPAANPELFDGVPARRIIAFLIDLFILAVPLIFLGIFFFAIGIFTLGIGFALYGLMPIISRFRWPMMPPSPRSMGDHGKCLPAPSPTIGRWW